MFVCTIPFDDSLTFAFAISEIDRETLDHALTPFVDLICPRKVEPGTSVQIVEVPDNLRAPGLKHYFKYIGHENFEGDKVLLEELKSELSVRERFYPMTNATWTGDTLTATVYIVELVSTTG